MLNTIAIDAAGRKQTAARRTSDEQLIGSSPRATARRCRLSHPAQDFRSEVRDADRSQSVDRRGSSERRFPRNLAQGGPLPVPFSGCHLAARDNPPQGARCAPPALFRSARSHLRRDDRRWADDPETTTYRNESSGIVHECLTRLSPLHRTIIDLVYLQERSVGEVARMIQVPESTVKTRMFYARKQMAGLSDRQGHRPRLALDSVGDCNCIANIFGHRRRDVRPAAPDASGLLT